jgi:hypothetical protein
MRGRAEDAVTTQAGDREVRADGHSQGQRGWNNNLHHRALVNARLKLFKQQKGENKAEKETLTLI